VGRTPSSARDPLVALLLATTLTSSSTFSSIRRENFATIGHQCWLTAVTGVS